MKYAIPLAKDEGINSRVYGHFGSAPYYGIYDDTTDSLQVIHSKNSHGSHGSCHSTTILKRLGVDAVICGDMGHNALLKFKNMGINVYYCPDQLTVKELVQKARENQLEKFDINDSCAAHGHHHDHDHHHYHPEHHQGGRRFQHNH
ncbi:MAG: NifB/NifX family molybdenum-iron cluster-binding protein [Calditerrivibrio sp.]|uniref:NifB/NifX family molybdenum-iron cluster-binding protein n=1 Tax=Calditerrivibrio sp. TaxID=2792612 RepID=UPI003D0B8EC2